jgi:membrane fusion protein, multidrug efflux system
VKSRQISQEVTMTKLETQRSAGFRSPDPDGFEEDRDDLPSESRETVSPPQPSAREPAVPQPTAPSLPVPQVDASAKGVPDTPAPRTGRRRAILVLALLAALGSGGYYGHYWWTEGRFLVSTDDAYVKADLSVIASKATGYVGSVPVTENQHVQAGELLAKIDDRDYQIAVEAARNKLATQNATIARLKEQTKAQSALIEQAKAQVASAQAGFTRASADFSRAQELANREYGSRQTLDQARAQRDQSQAAVAAAQAAQSSAEANLAVLNAQVEEAVHVRAELQTSVDQANLNFSYTEIRAPFDGVVGNKAVQPGQYVQPGTRLLSLVPLDTVYVEANYKETQLADIKPGQTVDVSVDAADGHAYHGVVESIAPASGSQFSLLPPENATGNFTKIVQRVPVRIRVSGEAVKSGLLRPGLSVVAYVHTKDGDTAQAAGNGAAMLSAQAAPAR